jgi:hypothetical protein
MKLDCAALRAGRMVADGGWSTQLQMRGVPGDVMAETANVTHAEIVLELAQTYLDAGAQFITTNTFAANRFGVERRELTISVEELNRRGAELARARPWASVLPSSPARWGRAEDHGGARGDAGAAHPVFTSRRPRSRRAAWTSLCWRRSRSWRRSCWRCAR